MILFAGYRPWAFKALERIRPIALKHIKVVTLNEELKALLTGSRRYDAVFLAGWSWILDAQLCRDNLIVGVHPSDLPRYAGGTPIQHQILDGVRTSKATLFRLTEKVDQGPTIIKEHLDLSGSLDEVFESLAIATARLYLRFESSLPNPPEMPPPVQDPPKEFHKRRLTPIDGRLTSSSLEKMTARGLYDFLRCREDVGGESVYPNSYFEDETGRVFFRKVGFKEQPDDHTGTTTTRSR